MIHVTCTACGKVCSAPAQSTAKTDRCPYCISTIDGPPSPPATLSRPPASKHPQDPVLRNSSLCFAGPYHPNGTVDSIDYRLWFLVILVILAPACLAAAMYLLYRALLFAGP